jgi:hypothetical protein
LDQLRLHAISLPVYLWEPQHPSDTKKSAIDQVEARLKKMVPSRAAVRRLATTPQGFQAEVERLMEGGVLTGLEGAVGHGSAVPKGPAGEVSGDWVELSSGVHHGWETLAFTHWFQGSHQRYTEDIVTTAYSLFD